MTPYRLALFQAKLARRFTPGMADECWVWCGSCDRDGYGRFYYEKKNRQAHRVSFEHYHGPIVDGNDVDHRCNRRNCCNPDHLQQVSHEENILLRDFRRSLATLYRVRPDQDPRRLVA